MSLGPSIIHLRFKGFKVIRIPEVSLLKNLKVWSTYLMCCGNWLWYYLLEIHKIVTLKSHLLHYEGLTGNLKTHHQLLSPLSVHGESLGKLLGEYFDHWYDGR